MSASLFQDLEANASNPTEQMRLLAQKIDTLTVSGGQGVAVANLGATSNMSAAVVVATSIPASNFTAAVPGTPTKAEVDAGIDTLKNAVVTALDLKADNADVETLRTQAEARLDAIEAKLDALLTSLRNSGQIA